MPRITIWNEYIHEKRDEAVRRLYPAGIHETLADAVRDSLGERGHDPSIRTATQDQPEHGLTQDLLAETDTLVWWAHVGHADVSDAVVDLVQKHVLAGMGLVVLHSAHFSKVFRRMMGTNCSLKWREGEDTEILWNVQPNHPIMQGIPEHVRLEREEMYGERFDIPTPDELLMLSWFSGGEVFRSLCTWQRGNGRVVYFRPGHETHPTYHDRHIRKIIANACLWARRSVTASTEDAPNTEPVIS